MIFLTGELCQRVTNAFDDLNDAIDLFDWYLFPTKVQKMLPIIMINSQQPIDFECFGNITCSRESFKKVKFKLDKMRNFW